MPVDLVPAPRLGFVQVSELRRGPVCAGCPAPLPPPRTGPGRPRRFCSPACRRRASRNVHGPGPVDVPPLCAFSSVLRAAIAASNLKLATVSRRLGAEHGLTVSATTLSNWQCDRPPRGRHSDRVRVRALEQVLGLRGNELVLLLDPPPADPDGQIRDLRARASRLGGTTGYETLTVADTAFIGADRRERRREVAQTLRAVADDVDCCWAFYAPGAPNAQVDVRAGRGCRLSRYLPYAPRASVVATELLFDRELHRGGTHSLEYGFAARHTGASEPMLRRSVRPTGLASLTLTACFEAPPPTVWAAEWAGDRPRNHVEVPVRDGIARLTLRDPAAAVYGLWWSW